MNRTRSFALGLALATGLPSVVPVAGADAPSPIEAGPAATDVASRAREAGAGAGPRGLEFSGDVVAQTLNTYLYRGLLTEDRGVIVQAFTDLHAKVPLGGFLDSIDVHAQFWNSFGTGPTGTGGPNESPRAWSEADLLLGVEFATSSGFSLDATYTWLRAPNGSFEDLDELAFTLAYDDSEAWRARPGAFRGWNPSLGVAIETVGRADLSGKSGTYLEFGVAPTFSAWKADDAPNIQVPVKVGTSLGHYYEDAAGRDHFFGFLDVGCDLEVPIGGAWTFNLSAHAVFLGETPREYGGDRDLRLVLTVGLTWSF